MSLNRAGDFQTRQPLIVLAVQRSIRKHRQHNIQHAQSVTAVDEKLLKTDVRLTEVLVHKHRHTTQVPIPVGQGDDEAYRADVAKRGHQSLEVQAVAGDVGHVHAQPRKHKPRTRRQRPELVHPGAHAQQQRSGNHQYIDERERPEVVFHPAQPGHHPQNNQRNQRFGLGKNRRGTLHSTFQNFGSEIVTEVPKG